MPKNQTPEEKRAADAQRLREWRQRKRQEYLAENGISEKDLPKRGRPKVSEKEQKKKKAEREARYREEKLLAASPKPLKEKKTKLAPRSKKQKKNLQPVSGSVDPVSSHFPADSIIAAAVNHKHGFSTVLAVGEADDSRETVIVERTQTEKGFYLFRVKITRYSYYKTKAAAWKAAKATGTKLALYDSFTSFEKESDEEAEPH